MKQETKMLDTHKQDYNEIIQILAELYPRTFFMSGPLRQPLKINILADILAQQPPELDGANVSAAIEWYTSHYGYQKSVAIAGSHRLDLDGNRVGTVTHKEAQQAVEKITEINANKNARGIPNPHEVLRNGFGRGNITSDAMSKVTASPLTDTELLTRAARKIVRVQPFIEGDDEDGLRCESSRPILKSIIDDLNALYARLK
jgi:hypothetical protein